MAPAGSVSTRRSATGGVGLDAEERDATADAREGLLGGAPLVAREVGGREVIGVVAEGLREAVDLLEADGDVEGDVRVRREALRGEVVPERCTAIAGTLGRDAELELHVGLGGEVELSALGGRGERERDEEEREEPKTHGPRVSARG